MNKYKCFLMLATLALSVFGGTKTFLPFVAYADEKSPTELSDMASMEKVLNLYSRIHRDLVTDSLGEIRDDASRLLIAARKLMDKKLSSDIEGAANRIISSSSTGMGHPSIPQAIDDFKKLSDPIVKWVKKNKPEGWIVIHCSKLEPSWVQKKDQVIQNPYSGKDKEMRNCGEKVF